MPTTPPYRSWEERQALYRGERSERNDDWTEQEIALNRAAHERGEARRALRLAEAELRIALDEAVNVDCLPLERVRQLTTLDEYQVVAELAEIERRDSELGVLALELRGARRGASDAERNAPARVQPPGENR